MVQGTSAAGSSSREYGIVFEIPPPATVRPGTCFTIPVIVAVRPVGKSGSPVQQLVANISLRNEAGTSPASGLGGNLTSSVRSRNGNTNSGYARFGSLSVSQPGRYRLRVMLGAASSSGVTTMEYVDSGIIHVDGGAEVQRPTPTQIARLRSLMAENIDISAADIAAWQRASV